MLQYLLHYLKSLYDWLDPEVVKSVPVAKTAWSLLRDSYHSDLSLRYQAEHIAVAVLYLALQIYGVEVPYSNKAEKKWWEVRSFSWILAKRGLMESCTCRCCLWGTPWPLIAGLLLTF